MKLSSQSVKAVDENQLLKIVTLKVVKRLLSSEVQTGDKYLARG